MAPDDPSEALLAAIVAVTGRGPADAVGDIAGMTLDELLRLVIGTPVASWTVLAVAQAHDELRRRAEHQQVLDWSIGGRRRRRPW